VPERCGEEGVGRPRDAALRYWKLALSSPVEWGRGIGKTRDLFSLEDGKMGEKEERERRESEGKTSDANEKNLVNDRSNHQTEDSTN